MAMACTYKNLPGSDEDEDAIESEGEPSDEIMLLHLSPSIYAGLIEDKYEKKGAYHCSTIKLDLVKILEAEKLKPKNFSLQMLDELIDVIRVSTNPNYLSFIGDVTGDLDVFNMISLLLSIRKNEIIVNSREYHSLLLDYWRKKQMDFILRKSLVLADDDDDDAPIRKRHSTEPVLVQAPKRSKKKNTPKLVIPTPKLVIPIDSDDENSFVIEISSDDSD